jgi:polyhydroxyalkanoate synthesis regulator phasin
MTSDEKREMMELMRQVIKEEVPQIVHEETADLRADLKKHLQDHQKYPTREDLLKLESRVDRLEAQLVKLLEER